MSRPNFRVSVSEDADDGPVVVVEGDLDLAATPALVDAIEAARARGGALVIDLSGTRFLDSSGVAVLVRAHGAQTADRRPLVLRWPSAPVMRVLNLAGLDQVFTVEPA